MFVKDAMALLRCADSQFLAEAGPAVLRLKLLELTHLAQSRRLTEEMREAAHVAAFELRRLIAERPCVSLIDHAAKREMAFASPAMSFSPLTNPPPAVTDAPPVGSAPRRAHVGQAHVGQAHVGQAHVTA